MSDLMKVIQDGNLAGLEVERARETLETAKAVWDSAKERYDLARADFDTVISGADEIGFPRAKLKKLLEERTAALWTSGLMPLGEERVKPPKSPRPARKPKTDLQAVEESFVETDAAVMN